MTGPNAGQPTWKLEHRELRRKEVNTAAEALRTQKLTARVQAVAVVAALVASMAAAYAAYQAGQAVRASESGAAQQASESQLTTAITAIGGSEATEQVAGLTLLRRNTESQITSALSTADKSVRSNAFSAYTTSLAVLSEYIHANTVTPSMRSSKNKNFFGPGYGIPGTQRLSVAYAIDQLETLLSIGPSVKALGDGPPSIDLAGDELAGLSMAGIDFQWLDSKYMLGIDLRGTNLTDSKWGYHAYLVHSYFQCADLAGANFRRAILTGADLRGANIQGADFRHAKLKGIKTRGAFGHAKGLRVAHPAARWNPNPGPCMRKRRYWDVPRVPATVPKHQVVCDLLNGRLRLGTRPASGPQQAMICSIRFEQLNPPRDGVTVVLTGAGRQSMYAVVTKHLHLNHAGHTPIPWLDHRGPAKIPCLLVRGRLRFGVHRAGGSGKTATCVIRLEQLHPLVDGVIFVLAEAGHASTYAVKAERPPARPRGHTILPWAA
jgi:Pentapeptide repeats (8 copies)